MSSQTTARLEAIVHGRVQGVYFRQYTLQEARRLRLVGWVANQMDGTVKVIAEGDEGDLQRLLLFLHEGPPAAHVAKVDSQWEPATGAFHEFRVRSL